ncbi:MAG: VIT and VWA domain-containing protein [Myxococcota bacterium]
MTHNLTISAALLTSLAMSGCGAQALAAGPKELTLTADRKTGTPLSLGRDIGPVYTDPGDVPQLQVEVDGKTVDLPLEHTHVKAEITGFVGRVRVTQTYQNPFDHPIEAIYIFPLPENSAVDDMRMKIGQREIIAEIKKREEARRTYEQAKKDGHTAALLEQERPNIFTQSVANIEPGKKIDVVISYLQTLTYDAGQYEFVFPMVVGPRFNPGAASDKPNSGKGWHPDTNQVPDASRISPPYLGGGVRSGHDISLELVADAGIPIRAWDAPTHQVEETATLDGTLKLALSDKDSIPNRDFILRYAVDGKLPQASLLTHTDSKKGGFFTLVVQPPKLDVDELVGHRELIFVMDVSGSMHGVPLDMGKDAMRQALRQLRPVDTFNVITFAGRTGQAFDAPRPANNSNLKAAVEYVDGLKAGGGTQMIKGVEAALSPPVEPGRHRYVFFMTDGYIGNEKEIHAGTERLIASLAERGQRARVFGYGLGSSVNRHLINGIADHGDGVAVYSSTREDPTGPVKQFFRYIDHAVMTDLDIDWGGLQVSDVYPTVKPDLFASRPTIIHGRYRGTGDRTIRIRGIANGRARTMKLSTKLPKEEPANQALATLWARSKIEDLERGMVRGGASSQLKDAITQVGLDYRIVTQFTSFVAVDSSKKIKGQSKTLVQPLEAPEGVNMQTAAPAKSMSFSGSASMGSGGLGMRKVKRRRPRLELSRPAPAPTGSNDAVAETEEDRTVPADAWAKKQPVVVQQLRKKIVAELLAAGLPVPKGTLQIRATLSRDGALLQPKLDHKGLSDSQRALILRVLRRYRVPGFSASAEEPVTLRITF